MDPFDPRAVDEDLELRARQRQVRNASRIELERDVALRLAVAVQLVEIGPQRCLHQGQVGAQNAVLIEARDGVQVGTDLRHEAVRVARGALRAAGRCRVEASLEQPHEVAGDGGVGGQHALHVGLTERYARLQKIAAVGAQHDDLARAEAGGEQQPVEAVVLHRAAPGRGQGLLEVAFQPCDVDFQPLAVLELEVLDPRGAAFRPAQLVRPLGDDAQPEVLQHRQQIRDGYGVAELDDFEVHAFQLLLGAAQRQAQRLRLGAQCLQIGEVVQHIARRHILLVGQREHASIAVHQRHARSLAVALDEHLAQPVGPGQGRLRDAPLDCGQVHFQPLARVGAHHDVHPGVIRA